jgi:hypothetical protein
MPIIYVLLLFPLLDNLGEQNKFMRNILQYNDHFYPFPNLCFSHTQWFSAHWSQTKYKTSGPYIK